MINLHLIQKSGRIMIDYIKGRTVELTPTDMVVECYGIGYRILISLQTYEGFNGKEDVTVYISEKTRNCTTVFPQRMKENFSGFL